MPLSKEERNAIQRDYRQAHKEELAAKRQAYYQAHKEEMRAKRRWNHSCCTILKQHVELLKDDPERLSTEFIKKLSRCVCNSKIEDSNSGGE